MQINAHVGQPEHGLTMVCINRQRSFIVFRSLSISFQRMQGVGEIVVRRCRVWLTCSSLREVMNRLLGLTILYKQHSKKADHILLPAIDAEGQSKRCDRLLNASAARVLQCLSDDALVVHGFALGAG